MTQHYEYRHTCPECGEEWVENRLKPKKQEKKKTCYKCKNKEVGEFSGLGQERDCGNCKYFQPLSEKNSEWGRCMRGKYLKNEHEYTLSYAIKNIDRCLIKQSDYEDFEEDVLNLVNTDCACNQHEYRKG